ncbi:MAG: hypothetical protein LBR23_01165 [Spirochaetaceae bacterium]|jgi:hypothetical protein|nr:hypothetical protein [Spirochaetaceae bacterium]
MTTQGDWREQKYAEVFESETRGLERRFSSGLCTLGDIENQLRFLYVQEGNDQGGRGVVGDIAIGAAIAAYERFIFARKGDPLGAR